MILSADWHLRKTRPRARCDDYWATQERKIRFILDLARSDPPLLVAGDFFHVPRPGEELLAWIIGLLKEYGVVPIVVPGQHDLPGHNLNQLHRSGLGVLAAAGAVELLTDPQFPTMRDKCMIEGVPYGLEPEQLLPSDDELFVQVLLWHHMVINEPLWPGQAADKAKAILDKQKNFDLIVTGDNHQSFLFAESASKYYSQPKRMLVNPGSIMRMTAVQVDHRPAVFRYDPVSRSIKQADMLPIEQDVFFMDDIKRAKDENLHMTAFIDQLDEHVEIGLNFIHNLRQYLEANRVSDAVKEIINTAAEVKDGLRGYGQ